jgi:hypothetical protein
MLKDSISRRFVGTTCLKKSLCGKYDLCVPGSYRPVAKLGKHDRISKLEMLDEVEELELMLSHYCVAWGSMGPIRSEIKLS